MKEKIDLSAVSETMLVPLYARAIESKKENPEFIDQTAIKVMDSLDYNFKKRFKTSTNKMNFWGCSARTANWMVKNQKAHDTVRTTGAVFKWGINESKDFEKLCSSYKLLAEYNLTDLMKKYSPIFIRLISPVLRSRNNRIALFEKIN